MAISTNFKYENTVNMSVGYNVGKGIPLDSRTVIKTKADLITSYDAANTAYKGMTVTVVDDPIADNNGLYCLLDPNLEGAGVAASWSKIGDVDQSELDAIIKAITDSAYGTGYTFTTGSTYSAATYDLNATNTILSSATSLADADAKIADALIEDERVISESLNDLDGRIEVLSGKSITTVTSTGNTIEVVYGKNTDGTKTVNLELDPSQVDVTDLNIGLHYDSTNAKLSISSTKDESVDALSILAKSFLSSVTTDEEANTITFNWIVSSATGGIQTSASTVPLSSLADLYSFDTTVPRTAEQLSATTGSNVTFVVGEASSTGVRAVSAYIDEFDCGEY